MSGELSQIAARTIGDLADATVRAWMSMHQTTAHGTGFPRTCLCGTVLADVDSEVEHLEQARDDAATRAREACRPVREYWQQHITDHTDLEGR